MAHEPDMQLIRYLEKVISGDSGYVQAQLAKEDLERVTKLRQLAQESESLAVMQKAGLYIGWTKGDFRTHELSEPLNALMASIYAFEHEGGDKPALEKDIMRHWTAFHTLRLKILVHCL